ncbi:MAG TPA: 4a-hydroxytetrahydrobiopterin dehydratase [Verrucomicrobiae bacterium]|nr:4a-hydroxytetrahydrobiopterin dehydratase [Verrucomicrobiae bacterium]
MPKLAEKRCLPCEGGAKPLDRIAAEKLLPEAGPLWKLSADGKQISATFDFKNYYRTTAFVNAVAWISHQEDHHPDIAFSYKNATVSYWTHAIDGLSENDFICAAKVTALV